MQHFAPEAGQEFNFFVEKLPTWTGWLATVVVDETGTTIGPDGTSKSLGNHTDLQLLLALRSKSSVIVTTERTARAEKYVASRFAPIAIITRNPTSLADIPAVSKPGANPLVTLTSNNAIEASFMSFTEQLEQAGYQRFLFEGGVISLRALVASGLPVTLVLSIANVTLPRSPNFQDLLDQLLGTKAALVITEAYSVGNNIVSVWSRPQS